MPNIAGEHNEWGRENGNTHAGRVHLRTRCTPPSLLPKNIDQDIHATQVRRGDVAIECGRSA